MSGDASIGCSRKKKYSKTQHSITCSGSEGLGVQVLYVNIWKPHCCPYPKSRIFGAKVVCALWDALSTEQCLTWRGLAVLIYFLGQSGGRYFSWRTTWKKPLTGNQRKCSEPGFPLEHGVILPCLLRVQRRVCHGVTIGDPKAGSKGQGLWTHKLNETQNGFS